MKKHKCDGVTAFILNWDQRTLSGWSYSVKEGDLVEIPMQSGRMAILKVTNLRRCSDPRDQYFADLIDVGYADEVRNLN